MWLKHLLIIVICEDASQTFQMRQSGQKQKFVSEQVTVKLDNIMIKHFFEMTTDNSENN